LQRKGEPEKGKAEPKPRLPVRCRASRPFGTIISAPRDLPVSGSRAHLHGCPLKRQRDPGLGPLFNVAWLRRDPNLGQIGTGVRRLSMRRKSPIDSPHGIAAKPTGRGTLRLLTPPPLAAHGNERPWACLARMSFRTVSGAFESSSGTLRIAPEIPSDDPISTFDNPSAHLVILYDDARRARGRELLIPIIHWAWCPASNAGFAH
jgi:hypothetical protein